MSRPVHSPAWAPPALSRRPTGRAELYGYARWVEGVKGLSEAGLADPVGEAEGPYADQPYGTLVLHINRIHHLAEVALLCDLYAHR
jgi:hypothetical protein